MTDDETHHTDQDLTDEYLLYEADHAATRAYCPYSDHAVGAVVAVSDGLIYRGCNVEVSGRVPSIHAEMMAVFHAVRCGYDEAIETVAVTEPPCGMCVHTLTEFCSPETRIVTPGGTWTLDELGGNLYWAGEHP